MRIVALMPMKGNSERVPNKNLKDFNGSPLYHVMMRNLLNCSRITDVVVNTDSQLLKDDLQKHFPQVLIHDRPVEIQGDFVSMNEIINHDLLNIEADIYIQTHSTNPILSSETLSKAIDFFLNEDHSKDSMFSVTRLQTRLYWEDGKALNHNPNELIRTQDLPVIFEENSCFFIFTKDSFYKASKKRIGINPYLFEIDRLEATDIDEPVEFELAKLIHTLKTR